MRPSSPTSVRQLKTELHSLWSFTGGLFCVPSREPFSTAANRGAKLRWLYQAGVKITTRTCPWSVVGFYSVSDSLILITQILSFDRLGCLVKNARHENRPDKLDFSLIKCVFDADYWKNTFFHILCPASFSSTMRYLISVHLVDFNTVISEVCM